MVERTTPSSAPLTGVRPARTVEENTPATPRPAPMLPKVPITKPEFEPNEAFADFDQTMEKTVKSLLSVIKSAPFNGSITDAQLKQMLAGKLGTKRLPPEWAELENVANLLSTPEGKAFREQLGQPINAAVLEAAPRVGFAKAHEALLKPRLENYAAALAGPLKPFVDSKFKALKVDQLRLLLSDGLIGGKKLTDLVPNEKERKTLLESVEMMTDNRRMFATVGTLSADKLKSLVAGGTVAVKDGSSDWSITLGDVTNATLPVKNAPEPMVDIHDPRWNKTKVKVLLAEYQAFLKDRKMVPFHEAWHSNNGSGGVNGPTSGEWFLQFHAHMGGDFVEFLKMRGKADAALVDGALPNWADMTRDLPEAFRSPGAGKNIDWEIPSFLARKTAASAAGQPFTLDRQKIQSLDDIKSMDDLGRVLGESGAHAVAHVELGGGMAGFKSVAEPAFMLWHYGALEKIRNQWLETDNGKKWLAANPLGWSKPFLDTHDEVMHDVVDQVVRARQTSSFEPARATRGGPVGASRPMAAAAPKSRGQQLREDRATAEERCASGLYGGGANGELFTRDMILEAAAGFKKQSAKAEGAARTAQKRARTASPSNPWNRS